MDLIGNFTTASANQDIFSAFITPLLTAQLNLNAVGRYMHLELLFNSDYTGDIVINGVTTKAWANASYEFRGVIRTLVISANGTAGQFRLNGVG